MPTALPSHLQFNPTTGFADLLLWLADFSQSETEWHVVPLVPAFATTPSGAADGCVAVNTAALVFPARPAGKAGSMILVASPMSSAVEEGNDWHCVVMMRRATGVFVYDPAFRAQGRPRVRRGQIPGTRNVWRMVLAKKWTSQNVWIQGPPAEEAVAELECMGRSALYMEAMAQEAAPFATEEWTAVVP